MILVLVPSLIPDEEDTQQSEELLTYRNPVYNYEITHPVYWDLEGVSNRSRDAIFSLPGELGNSPQLGIRVDNVPENTRLDQYARQHIRLVPANSSVPSTLDNHPAYTIMWTNSSHSGTKKQGRRASIVY